MPELDHFHPVLQSRELGDAPVGIAVCGRELVVFRTGDGRLGALDDRCPHRGMRLSRGHVEQARVVCPYHGYRFAVDGTGESPGSPRLRACAEAFDAVERLGTVWVRRRGAPSAFPTFDVGGWEQVAGLRHRVRAPLDVLVDNFVEVEHTPTTHKFLGYPLERMAEVVTEVDSSETAVRVYNRGPQRRLPWILRRLFGIEPGDHFVDDWTTRFAPVHTVYDQYWLDPATGERRPYALRIVVFFTPITGEVTDLFTFAYAMTPLPPALGGARLLTPLMRVLTEVEVRQDRRMVEGLTEAGRSLRGKRLGRFDRGVVATRQRIDRIYRGGGEAAQPATPNGDEGPAGQRRVSPRWED